MNTITTARAENNATIGNGTKVHAVKVYTHLDENGVVERHNVYVVCGAMRTTNYAKSQPLRAVDGEVTCAKCIKQIAAGEFGEPEEAAEAVEDAQPDTLAELASIVAYREDKAARNALILTALTAGNLTAKDIAAALGIETRAVNEAATRLRARLAA